MNFRLFCALPVPSPVQNRLVEVCGSLRGTLTPASISWTKPGNFHLTLSFLGDVEETCVEQLSVRLRESCQDIKSFHLECRSLGCFPNVSRPRVLWVGVHSDQTELALLQSRVAAVCAPFAERAEKGRFHGHVTLGRIRPSVALTRGKLEGEIERTSASAWGEWTADEVQLICSDLSQGAPKYSILRRISLE